jgi:hypothetical protein
VNFASNLESSDIVPSAEEQHSQEETTNEEEEESEQDIYWSMHGKPKPRNDPNKPRFVIR